MSNHDNSIGEYIIYIKVKENWMIKDFIIIWYDKINKVKSHQTLMGKAQHWVVVEGVFNYKSWKHFWIFIMLSCSNFGSGSTIYYFGPPKKP